jgi:hypothetical protein
VSPILGIASRHVAAQTVSIPAGMRSREVCCVAGEAARAVILVLLHHSGLLRAVKLSYENWLGLFGKKEKGQRPVAAIHHD